jgi:hypothetical protein
MGFINQASATAANSSMFTYSAVVELPAPCNVNILEFGHPYTADGFPANFISIANDGSFGNFLGVQLQGVIDEFTDITPYLTATDEVNDLQWNVMVAASWTGKFFATVSSLGSAVAAGTRFHLFIAANFTNTVVEGGTTNTCFVFINGARLDWDTSGIFGRIVDQASGQVQQGFLEGVGGGVGNYVTGPFSISHGVQGGGTATLTGHVPGFSFDLNGKEIAIPQQAAHAASGVVGNTEAVKMADIQIWVDRYIDPTIHIDKFYRDGAPVNPTEAADAFGAPTYRLQGPSSGITTNGGSGGDFVKSGTVADTMF